MRVGHGAQSRFYLDAAKQISGQPPYHLDPHLTIAERRGCDLHPLDAGNPADRNTLLSFVWPDQLERFERLRAALVIAKQKPVVVDEADGIDWIGKMASPLRRGLTTVALHVVVTEHMPPDVRNRLHYVVTHVGESAKADAPFASVRMEPAVAAYETNVPIWPGGQKTCIARSDGHAQRLQ